MIETLAFVFLRQGLPVQFRGLEHRQCTHYIRAGEGERIFDRAIYVALSGEVDYTCDVFFLHQRIDGIEVADICTYETVVRLVFDILEIRQVTGIGQLIQIDDTIVRIFVHK